MNAPAHRAAAFLVVALTLAAVLPTAEAQVPPPPKPPSYPLYCQAPLFPVLDFVTDCTPNLASLEPLYEWALSVGDWLRCDILGGAAC